MESAPPAVPPLALIVDDSADSAFALAMMIETQGWRTEIAQDGVEALRKANASRPALVLLDIGMPKLDGVDACSVIRAQPWAAQTRVVAVTGLPPEEVRKRAPHHSFDAVLLKPVGVEELLDVVGKARPRAADAASH